MSDDDVPPGVDFHDAAETAAWIATADAKRPVRTELRRIIATRVAEVAPALGAPRLPGASRGHVLELGGGPGYLAEAVLAACDVERYVLLDFAQPMLDAARARLGDRVTYHRDDFLDPAWPSRLAGPFDAVVTMQAVHELRHKRRAPGLFAQARALMRPGAVLVVCDHLPKDDAKSRALYATEAEQRAALEGAGFVEILTLASFEGLYVMSASS